MNNIIEETKGSFVDRIIQAMDHLLDEKKNALTKIRKDAKTQIGTGSKSAGTARTILYKKLGEIKDEIDGKLAEFKAEIRYKPSVKRREFQEDSRMKNRKFPRY